MLVCAPFHSVANPPVGMAYLTSYLAAKGIDCQPRDLNIEAREFLRRVPGPDGKPGGYTAVADELFALARRTYLGEAAAWSWFNDDGAEAVISRALTHPFVPLREFWRGANVERLRDPIFRAGIEALQGWLLNAAEQIVRHAQGWVGFSTTITNFAPTLFLARCLRELDPDLLLIIGGPHLTRRNAEQILRTCKVFDLAVSVPAFEALEVLLGDLDAARRGSLPPGAWRAKRRTTNRTHPAEADVIDVESCVSPTRIDLNALPPADWTWARLTRHDSGFLMKNSTGDFSKWLPTIPLQTSRGCSYSRCKFCHNVIDYPKYSMQRPDRVADEIRHQIAKIGSRGFFFTDDEFSGSRRRTIEICDELRKLDEDIRFFCWVRLDKIDSELLEQMYIAGARQLFIGVEAVDDDLLALMDKGYGSQEAVENLTMLRDFADRHPDFVYIFNLIVDYPGETIESVRNTLAIVAEYPDLFVGRVAACCVFHLYEGTPAFERLGDRSIGCIEPLLPKDLAIPDLRYLYQPIGAETRAARMEIWSAIADFVRFKEPNDHGRSRNTIAIYD